MGITLWPKGGIKSSKLPPYPFAMTRPKTEIDLREEMQIMLEGNQYWPRRGHWTVLRRMDQRQRCYCWNEQGVGENQYSDDKRKYDEPKLRCPACHGEGWLYKDELYLVRRRLVAPEIGLAASETESDIGLMNINYVVFYYQYYVDPKKEDIILEIELDADGNPVRPFVYKERYNIALAEPYRDQIGRIEYWRVAAKLETT
jgi:hypothetical protein